MLIQKYIYIFFLNLDEGYDIHFFFFSFIFIFTVEKAGAEDVSVCGYPMSQYVTSLNVSLGTRKHLCPYALLLSTRMRTREPMA